MVLRELRAVMAVTFMRHENTFKECPTVASPLNALAESISDCKHYVYCTIK